VVQRLVARRRTVQVADPVDPVDLEDEAAERVGVAARAGELDPQRVLELRLGQQRTEAVHRSSPVRPSRAARRPASRAGAAARPPNLFNSSALRNRTRRRGDAPRDLGTKKKSFRRGRRKLSCISASTRSEMAVGEGKDSDRRKRRNAFSWFEDDVFEVSPGSTFVSRVRGVAAVRFQSFRSQVAARAAVPRLKIRVLLVEEPRIRWRAETVASTARAEKGSFRGLFRFRTTMAERFDGGS